MQVSTVVFDVGETLIDETELWGRWADWLGVPRLTLFAVLGAVIERGEDHRRTFELLRPGFDADAERERRAAAGVPDGVDASMLYPDALDALRAIRARGCRIGLAGNNAPQIEASLGGLGLDPDFISSSSSVGYEKPDPRFFRALAERAGDPPQRIAYVGDRIDNDIVPAADAGMHAIWIRRGPWAHIQREHRGVARASAVIASLSELADLLVPHQG